MPYSGKEKVSDYRCDKHRAKPKRTFRLLVAGRNPSRFVLNELGRLKHSSLKVKRFPARPPFEEMCADSLTKAQTQFKYEAS